MSHESVSARGKTVCVTHTAAAPILKIIQKKTECVLCVLCLHTCVCVCSQLVEPCHRQLSSFHTHTQIFLRHAHPLQRTLFFFTQRDSGRHGPTVDPEWYPWQHHHECGRKVCLQQEEEDVASQCEVDVETIVPACEHSKTPDKH